MTNIVIDLMFFYWDYFVASLLAMTRLRKTTKSITTGIPLLWRGGENSKRIFDGVVLEVNCEQSIVNFYYAKFIVYYLAPIETITPQQELGKRWREE